MMSEIKTAKTPKKTPFLAIVKRLTILLFVITTVSFFGEFTVYFELFSHFRVQYSFLFLGSLVFLGVAKAWKWLPLPLLGLLLNFVPIVPYWLSPPPVPKSARLHKVRILVSNVRSSNENYSAVKKQIQKHDPDIVGLIEVSRRWLRELGPATKHFKYRYDVPRGDNFGLALFSKFKLNHVHKRYLGNTSLPTIVADVDLKGERFSFVLTHPLPPVGTRLFRLRNRQMAAVADYIAKKKGPVVLAGDLNVTMWSPFYDLLLEKTGLHNARRGFGIVPTWTVIPFMGIPIDHILVSQDIRTIAFRALGAIGSDHLPNLADLQIGFQTSRNVRKKK